MSIAAVRPLMPWFAQKWPKSFFITIKIRMYANYVNKFQTMSWRTRKFKSINRFNIFWFLQIYVLWFDSLQFNNLLNLLRKRFSLPTYVMISLKYRRALNKLVHSQYNWLRWLPYVYDPTIAKFGWQLKVSCLTSFKLVLFSQFLIIYLQKDRFIWA